MENTSLLMWGMIFGSFGLGFFTYGKKQRAAVPLVTGIVLFVLPYFVTNIYWLGTAGFVLILVPFFVKI